MSTNIPTDTRPAQALRPRVVVVGDPAGAALLAAKFDATPVRDVVAADAALIVATAGVLEPAAAKAVQAVQRRGIPALVLACKRSALSMCRTTLREGGRLVLDPPPGGAGRTLLAALGARVPPAPMETVKAEAPAPVETVEDEDSPLRDIEAARRLLVKSGREPTDRAVDRLAPLMPVWRAKGGKHTEASKRRSAFVMLVRKGDTPTAAAIDAVLEQRQARKARIERGHRTRVEELARGREQAATIAAEAVATTGEGIKWADLSSTLGLEFASRGPVIHKLLDEGVLVEVEASEEAPARLYPGPVTS